VDAVKKRYLLPLLRLLLGFLGRRARSLLIVPTELSLLSMKSSGAMEKDQTSNRTRRYNGINEGADLPEEDEENGDRLRGTRDHQ
jgi:hypothetical protein